MHGLVKDNMPLCPYGEGILGEPDGNMMGTHWEQGEKKPLKIQPRATSFPEKKKKILNSL
jgi:hypothetical protein